MSTPKRPPVRLLVVDDDQDLRDLLGLRFRRQGFSVTEAGSGQETLAQPGATRWDVALVDLQLPDLSGLDLLEQLKARQPDLEVLMLTAHATVETATEAMKKGAYDYLTKPLRLPDLDVHVQKAYEKV